MSVFKFAKIDLMEIKRYWFMVLFPILAILFIVREPDTSAFFGVAYCLFMGIVIAMNPFSRRTADENGFLHMLPAMPGDDIRGHFFYGGMVNLLAFALGLLANWIAHLINPEVQFLQAGTVNLTGFYMALLGAAFLVTGLQGLVQSVFSFDKTFALQMVRLVPAFLFFFISNGISDELGSMGSSGAGSALVANAMRTGMTALGAGGLLAGIVGLAVMGEVAARVVVKRQ